MVDEIVDIHITIQHLPHIRPVPIPSDWTVGEAEDTSPVKHLFTGGVVELNIEFILSFFNYYF